MSSLRMGTKDVISTGLSFLVVVVVLHIVVAIIWGIGFGLFELFATEECPEWGDCYSEYSTASWIFGMLFWVVAGIILFCGYIGLWTKLFTDSIAMGVYKANNADEEARLADAFQSAPATTVVSAAPMASVATAPAQQPTPIQQQQPQDPQQNAMVLENQYQQ
jgi:ABC-type amino acid transport system permease subunit